MHPSASATSTPGARERRFSCDGGGRSAGRRGDGDLSGCRGGLAPMRSMGSSGGVRARQREKGLLKTRPDTWTRSDPGGQLAWLGENDDDDDDDDDDDILVEPGRSGPQVQTPQSMLLTADQNNIMHLPNYSCFMHHQRTRRPCAMKRIKLAHLRGTADKNNDSGDTTPDSHEPDRRGQGRTRSAAGAPSPEELPATEPPAAPATSPRLEASAGSGKSGKGPTTTPAAPAVASMGSWRGVAPTELGLSRTSVGRGGGGKDKGDEKWGSKRGGEKKGNNKRTAMTYEQCLKEVGLLKNLTSPNIVKLHTWFLDRNALWLVMDWVDGGDLRGMLDRTKKAGNRLSEVTIWRLFTQMCDGLLHMHGERIMHRDLKPANVLLCRDGTVKLGDLGLGRYLDVQSVLAMSRVGTPLYMSPETLKGRGHGMVSDIWSLGCILYELTMLASPFEGRHLTLKALFSKIVRADYPPIDSALYNEQFGNLVAHLLIPDPNLRPKITVVHPAAHLALVRSQQDAAEEQLAAAAAAANAGDDHDDVYHADA
eukprot:g7592.t1